MNDNTVKETVEELLVPATELLETLNNDEYIASHVEALELDDFAAVLDMVSELQIQATNACASILSQNLHKRPPLLREGLSNLLKNIDNQEYSIMRYLEEVKRQCEILKVKTPAKTPDKVTLQ